MGKQQGKKEKGIKNIWRLCLYSKFCTITNSPFFYSAGPICSIDRNEGSYSPTFQSSWFHPGLLNIIDSTLGLFGLLFCIILSPTFIIPWILSLFSLQFIYFPLSYYVSPCCYYLFLSFQSNFSSPAPYNPFPYPYSKYNVQIDSISNTNLFNFFQSLHSMPPFYLFYKSIWLFVPFTVDFPHFSCQYVIISGLDWLMSCFTTSTSYKL